MLHEIFCSCCQTKILRKSQDGNWRISNKVMMMGKDGNGVCAVCKDCGHEQPMPFTIVMKSEPAEEYEETVCGPYRVRKKKNLDL